MAVRCPKCNRYGSADLGGYCKSCKDSRRKSNYVGRSLMKRDYGFKTGKAFAPGQYGIMRGQFPIIEKGE